MLFIFSLISLQYFYIFAAPTLCVTDICQVPASDSMYINRFGYDYLIDNFAAKDLMIPQKTCPELKSFIELSAVPGVTKTDQGSDPCACKTMGTALAGGPICAGTFQGSKYMMTPGGCTNSSTPTCAGGVDIIKIWNGTAGGFVDIAGVSNVTVAATASVQTGDVTTAAIVADASIDPDSAADYCNDMSYGGYTDWYLPSKSEIVYVYCNSNMSGTRTAGNPQEQTDCAGVYGGPTTLLTGFIGTPSYWASTENTSTDVWSISFFNGSLFGATSKANIFLQVRCLRKY